MSAAKDESRSTEKLERILDDVQNEWGVGGLDSSTMYGEFAMVVAQRFADWLADEIERTSKETYGVVLMEHKEASEWLRSNVEVRGSRSAKHVGNQQAQLVGCPARLQS
jgi:hypothetical protein